MSAPLPIPPSGIPVFNPSTGGMDTQWQNYFLQLTIAIGTLGAAPADGPYVTYEANGTLTNGQNLGALTTGVLYHVVAAAISTIHSEALLNVIRGGTGSDLSITGGTNQILKQTGLGSAVTVGTLAATQLSDYATNTWTPADGSGAALALTVTTATYVRVGSLVALQADITYPVTVDGSNSRISGLPFPAIAANFVLADGGNFGAAYTTQVNSGASTIDLLTTAGVRILNSALSTVNLKFTGVYRT
jgi:hypothetical protein